MNPDLEPCPGCQALWPRVEGPTHRYIGASPSCWAIYTTVLGGEIPVLGLPVQTAEPVPLQRPLSRELLVDAYAAQHPGEPSPQAIQSVAVHLLALHAVIDQGVAPEHLLWVRRCAVRERGVFRWLEPPSFRDRLNIGHVAVAADEAERRRRVGEYAVSVWTTWAETYRQVVSEWHERFVNSE
ncbi:MAG TPA: DUF5946 family protein [Thermoanaerobaculia bacterium]|nr:DUF5946 family protein [Thermoanaerobaculia bacterium]